MHPCSRGRHISGCCFFRTPSSGAWHADCSCMTCAPLPHALDKKPPNITSLLANVDLSNQAMKLRRTPPSVRRRACLCMTLQNKGRADMSTF